MNKQDLETAKMKLPLLQQSLTSEALSKNFQTDEIAFRSQKHIVLQSEIYSRFSRLEDQYRVNTKNSEAYEMQKLKLDTKRIDNGNHTYR
jgi:hypothetical protein